MHPEAELLLRFGQLGGFVIGLDPRQHVGIQIAAPQTRSVAVDVLALARFDLGQLALGAQIDAGIIHQFGDAGDALVADHQSEVLRRDSGARRLPRAWPARRRGA